MGDRVLPAHEALVAMNGPPATPARARRAPCQRRRERGTNYGCPTKLTCLTQVFAVSWFARIVLLMPGTDTIEAPLLEVEPELDIVDELQSSRPAHPALGRLHDRLVGVTPQREITSYDRMHHRHNRK